jgi:predicted transcriptional regulator
MISVPTVLWDDFPRVRESDPVTSHEAADSNNVSRSHQLVAKLLEQWGAVAQFEAENLLRGVLSPSRVRSAFSELETLGRVKRTDEFRATPSGRRAQVWALA